MAIKQSELAEHWKVSEAMVSKLVAKGMPTTSLADAEAWRAGRKGAQAYQAKRDAGLMPEQGTEDAQEALAKPEDPVVKTAVEEAVEKQRLLVQISRNKYVKAFNDNDPRQGAYYNTYDKTLQTLVKLEEKALARAITTKKFIDKYAAQQEFIKVINAIKQELEQMEFELAPAANPDNPAKALKAIREWRSKALEKIGDLVRTGR